MALDSIHIDPTVLAKLREALKGDPEWAHYADDPDSELVELAISFAQDQLRPDVSLFTTADFEKIVKDAIQFNIWEVAQALGGAAYLSPDGTITVTRYESDSSEIFNETTGKLRRMPMLH